MKTTTAVALLALSLFYVPSAQADSFGSGANTFNIEFVPIGKPGNPDDTMGNPNPAGKVDYRYRIGKFEISENMINKANNLGGLRITHSNFGANKPALEINWYEAATFVNWLNTSKSFTRAYKFDARGNFQLWAPSDAGYNPNNLYRNSLARYFLPSMDEWYKAAYYNANSGVYYDYPTGSDSVPDGIDFPGDPSFDAVFNDGINNLLPNDVTDVGVSSPYGTFGQGGNAWELEETDFDLINDSTSSSRGVRGGVWYFNSNSLLSSIRDEIPASLAVNVSGFRVASIPEPNTALLGALASVGALVWWKRLR